MRFFALIFATIVISQSSLNEKEKSKIDLEDILNDKKGETHQFTSDVSRIFKLLTERLYGQRGTFIRELVSNSIDAIRKCKELLLQNYEKTNATEELKQFKIIVDMDKKKGEILISDNGVGMTRDDLIQFLGTIAKSGTATFNKINNLSKEDTDSFIGQFGIGFYSAFLVADKITVITKNDQDKQWVWQNDGSSSYNLIEDPRGTTIKRGTQVILKLKPDALNFLEYDEMEKLLKQYFGYEHTSIYLMKYSTSPATDDPKSTDASKSEKSEQIQLEEDLNKDKSNVTNAQEEKSDKEIAQEVDDKSKDSSKKQDEMVLISQSQTPLWKKDPKTTPKEEYSSFYKTLMKDYTDPVTFVHFKATGATTDFQSMLFIPKEPLYKPYERDVDVENIKVFVRGIHVPCKLNLLPKHLSFVVGVVNSDELPLSISRENILSNEEVKTIQKKLTAKAIDMIDQLAEDTDKYQSFYNSYSAHLKLGAIEDHKNRNKFSKTIRYKSSMSNDRMISFQQYIESISPKDEKEDPSKESTTDKKSQKIFYLAAGNENEIKSSPFAENLLNRSIPFLFLVDPIDEHLIQTLGEFEGWSFQNIAKEGFMSTTDPVSNDMIEKFNPLTSAMKDILKDNVEKVIISKRLSKTPCVLVANDIGWTGNMERIISAQSSFKDDPMLKFFSNMKKTLEINPENEIIKNLLEKSTKNKDDSELVLSVKVLYDLAALSSGFSIKDPRSFTVLMEELLSKAISKDTKEAAKSETKNSININNATSSETANVQTQDDNTKEDL